MKKNNKGFTLIELLVAIVIMISILTLAIISFNNISKEKKKEARKKVEEQAELAAKEFFEANEYQFEDMTVGSTKTILLEELVENGYITSLTDPVSGKKFNKCNYVSVTKKKNKYEYKFSDDVNCNPRNTYVSTIVDPQTNEKLKIKITINDTTACDKEGNNYNESIKWCKGKVTYELSEPICEKKNGESTDCPEGNYFENDTEKGNQKIYEYSDNSDTIQEVSYKYCALDDSKNCSDTIMEKYIIDNEVPSVTAEATDCAEGTLTDKKMSTSSFNDVGWTNKSVCFSVSATDTYSKIDTSHNYSTGTGLFNMKWDKGGETSVPSIDINNNIAYPTGSKYGYITLENGNWEEYQNGNQTAQEVRPRIETIDNGYKKVGVTISGSGRKYQTYEACDKAGNCSHVNILANVDKAQPDLNITARECDTGMAANTKFSTASSDAAGWTNKNVCYNIVTSDALSGIDENHLFEDNNTGIIKQEKDVNANFDSVDTSNLALSYLKYPSNIISKSGNKYSRTDDYFTGQGMRFRRYTVYDKAGNPATVNLYANIDKTAPVITNLQTPFYDSTNICANGKKVLYTKFSVYDNNKVYFVGHYMTNKEETQKNIKKFSSVSDGMNNITNQSKPTILVSVYKGIITNSKTKKIGAQKYNDFFEYDRFSSSTYSTGTSVSGRTYTVSRKWQYETTGADEGCGTISNADKQMPGETPYCSYAAAEDIAGNTTVARFCQSGRTSQCKINDGSCTINDNRTQ